jgi:lysozyme
MIDALLDLSHWQAPVDFAAVKAGCVAAVILKATQGASWVDATFVGRAAQALRAGLLVGAYHFADASNPLQQAAHFLNIAGSLPVLAIDIEPNGLGDTVSVAQAAELAARLQMATGHLPIVYMGRWGPAGNGAGLPNAVLARCPLWLPEYGNAPIPPAGWANWTLWQYTETGTVAGVGSQCDRSRFSGSLADLTAFWG